MMCETIGKSNQEEKYRKFLIGYDNPISYRADKGVEKPDYNQKMDIVLGSTKLNRKHLLLLALGHVCV